MARSLYFLTDSSQRQLDTSIFHAVCIAIVANLLSAFIVTAAIRLLSVDGGGRSAL